MTDEIKLDLKQPMMNVDAESFTQPEKIGLLPQFEKNTGAEIKEMLDKMTMQDVRKITPIFTFGDALKTIFSVTFKPTNNEESMQCFRFIRSINNHIQTSKGQWSVSLDEIKLMEKFIGTIDKDIKTLLIGQVCVILEEYRSKLIESTSKK